jgi:hypothetical protein
VQKPLFNIENSDSDSCESRTNSNRQLTTK